LDDQRSANENEQAIGNLSQSLTRQQGLKERHTLKSKHLGRPKVAVVDAAIHAFQIQEKSQG
jgi:hypothetical protein